MTRTASGLESISRWRRPVAAATAPSVPEPANGSRTRSPGREKTGYPTQKPEGLLRRFVQASSREGDLCLDPFAGSGTLGAVARTLGRRYLLIDESPEAVRVMRERLE